MAEWDEEIDELYGLEPGGFVAARNALAKTIKAAGDKDRAAVVARLGRPTIVAWALNQAVREDRERVVELIDAAARVATAQADLMAGGDPADLRAATTAQRAGARDVVHAAVTRAGTNHADAIRTTLDAALADPELIEQLRAGTLSDTLDAPAGFGFGFDAAPSVDELAPRRRAREAAKARSEAERTSPRSRPAPTEEDDAAQKAAAEARALVRRLEEEEAAADKVVERATSAVERAEQAHRDAEDELAAAQARVDATDADRDQATEAATTAEEERARIGALLDEARRLLDEL